MFLPVLISLLALNAVGCRALLVNNRHLKISLASRLAIRKQQLHGHPINFRNTMGVLWALDDKRDDSALYPKASLSFSLSKGDSNSNVENNDNMTAEQGQAAINTINERLLAELEEARNREKFGSRSGDKRFRFELRPPKSDEEKWAAIEEARNLNGVNPAVTIVGSMFALAIAAGLWVSTNYLGEYFALHPIESEVYVVERITAVFRNIVIGLVALASGFFGVTGMGIFLLGVRVAYGVATGELDPTPIKKKDSEEVVLPNVWDLMLNKRPSRRGKKDGNDNPFGI